jgi:hypothetical protein
MFDSDDPQAVWDGSYHRDDEITGRVYAAKFAGAAYAHDRHAAAALTTVTATGSA